MPKSKHQLDLNIKREVTRRISETVSELCMATIQENSNWSYPDSAAADFPFQYLADVLLSKYVDENTDSPDLRRTRAIEKWLGVEQRNQRTNDRLFTTDPEFTGVGHGWAILRLAARLVKGVIGLTPPDGLLLKGAFTGGATSSRKRGVETLASKFMGKLDATPDCANAFFQQWNEATEPFEAWSFYQPEVLKPRLVKGNVLFTVPKTAVIDRVACKEPDLNIFCQKAVGDFLRRRLKKRAHIDLNDQSINQDLARKGSISGDLATIDLSSASDSLTRSLVCALLPLEWFRLLDSLRSPKTFIDGKSHTNEMFSSMGNGFTFELQSMLFWALAQATCRLSGTFGKISVYGDDIIVPTSIARVFLQVLRWAGFVPNVSKTFVTGPFRESCGGHYYRGQDVSPFYLRGPIKDVSDLILFLNQFRAWVIRVEADSIDGGYTGLNRFTRFWYDLATFVPKPLWGGYSLESRTQLASPGPQQCELLMTTRKWARLETQHQIGLYLSRLIRLDRSSDAPPRNPGFLISTSRDGRSWVTAAQPEYAMFSELLSDSGKYSIRRVKAEPSVFGLARPLFICEQMESTR